MLQKILPNLGLPTKYQWWRILLNSIFAFLATFTGCLAPVLDKITPDKAGIALVVSLLVTSFFAAMKAAWTTLVEKPER